MGKRKHKHKRRHTDQKTNEKAPFTRIDSRVVIRTEDGAETAETSYSNRNDKQEPSMGFRELAERSSLTDWLIALFTFVLAGASIYQFIIMNGQLDTLRKDERPWLKIDFTMNGPQANQPISGIIHVINSGKTPAREINADMVIERVKNGETARLDYPMPHGGFSTGLMFPNVPVDSPMAMMHTTTEVETMMQSELEDFQSLRIFFVMYATVRYKDFFGVDHWTKMCTVVTPANAPGGFTGRNCTNYGDVDTN